MFLLPLNWVSTWGCAGVQAAGAPPAGDDAGTAEAGGGARRTAGEEGCRDPRLQGERSRADQRYTHIQPQAHTHTHTPTSKPSCLTRPVSAREEGDALPYVSECMNVSALNVPRRRGVRDCSPRRQTTRDKHAET